MTKEDHKRTSILAKVDVWIGLIFGVFVNVLSSALELATGGAPLPVGAFAARVLACALPWIALSTVVRRLKRPSLARRRAEALKNIAEQVKRDWISGPLQEGNEMEGWLQPEYAVFSANGENRSQQEEFSSAKREGRLVIVGDEGNGRNEFFARVLNDFILASDRSGAVPVVLSADTWFDVNRVSLRVEQDSIKSWIQNQLEKIYDVDRETAKYLATSGDLILCVNDIDRLCLGYELKENVSDSEVEEVPKAAKKSIWSPEETIETFLFTLNEYARGNVSGSRLVKVPLVLTVSDVRIFEDRKARLSGLRSLCKVVLTQLSRDDLLNRLSERNLKDLAIFLRDHDALARSLLENLFALNLFIRKYGEPTLSDLERYWDNARKLDTTCPEDVMIGDCFYDHFRRKSLSLCDKGELSEDEVYDQTERYLIHLAAYYGDGDYSAVFRIDEVSPESLKGSKIRNQYRRILNRYIFICIALTAGIPPAIGCGLGWYLRTTPAPTGIWGEEFGPASLQLCVLRGLIVFCLIGGVAGLIASWTYAYDLLGTPEWQSEASSSQRQCTEADRKGTVQDTRRIFSKYRLGHLVRAISLGLAMGIGRFATVAFSVPLPGLHSLSDAVGQSVSAFLVASAFFMICFNVLEDDPMVIRIEERKQSLDPWRAGICAAIGVVMGAGTYLADQSHEVLRAVSFGICGFVVTLIFFGGKRTATSLRIRPNREIDYLTKMSLLRAGIFACVGAAVFFTHDIYRYHEMSMAIGNSVQAFFLLVFFFFFGGLTVVKHYALRASLKSAGLIRSKYVTLLAGAAKIGVLRTLGGGFCFPSASVFKYLDRQAQSDEDFRWCR